MFVWSSIAHLIALTSPGPDTAVTIRQASLYGRNAGIFTALGIGVGIYIHCFLAINGISLLILENDLYKFSISIIGSSYIFYLGIAMLKNYSEIDNDKNNSDNYSSIYGSFFSGLITNIFNIKAFIFFVSLFTILIDTIQGMLFYLYPIYFSITSALWFMLVSFLLTSSKTINIHKYKSINYLLSAVLCVIGLFIFIKSIYEYF
jgi:threonine/homoserine/homoserine lactone efflux protein